MRIALLVVLLACLVTAIAGLVFRLAAPSAPQAPSTRAGEGTLARATAGSTVTNDPAPRSPSGPGEASDAPPARSDRGIPEPPEWADIERSLREEPDRETELTRRDLEATRVSIDFRDAPLEDVARRLAKQSGHEVGIDARLWEERTRDEVRVTTGPRTLDAAEALDLVCGDRKLVWWVDGSEVRIGPRLPAPELVDVRFPVDRLELPGFDANDVPDLVVDLVRSRIDPATWHGSGGPSTIRCDGRNGLVVVRAPRSTQRKILAFLRTLLRDPPRLVEKATRR